MKNIKFDEVEDYIMNVKEITFTYNGLRFAIRKNTSSSYSETFVIDLNLGDDKLSQEELVNLKSEIMENYEFDDFEVGDDIDLE